MSARPGSQKPMGKPAGVGIYFQESGSDIVVNHLIRGGSAERSGKVQSGDVIVSIDDRDVRGKGVGEMRNFIVGPEGSTVNLGFVRDGQSFTVALLRGSPEYITSVMGPSASATKSPMVNNAPSPRLAMSRSPAVAQRSVPPPPPSETSLPVEQPGGAQAANQIVIPQRSRTAQRAAGRAAGTPPASTDRGMFGGFFGGGNDSEGLMTMAPAPSGDVAKENESLKMKLAEAEQRAQVASAALQQTKSSSAEAMQHAQAEKDRAVMQAQQLQESRMKAERDVETHRRVAMDLEVALRKEKEEVQRLKTAPPIAKPGPSAQEESLLQQVAALREALDQSKMEQAALAQRLETAQSASAAPVPTSAEPTGEAQRLRTMLEQKNSECNRLQTEVRQAKEEAKSSVAQLQEAMQSAQGTPMQLDAEFRDTGRAAIIALPHVITHLQNVIDNQDRIRSLVPVTTVMLHALETSRQRCAACIPQAVPQLVSLLVSRQPTTVREASFALSLTSMSSEGRKAILSMPQALAHLETLLSSADIQSRRNGAMALGNLAMDAPGRKGMLEIFTIVQDLTQLLSNDDLDCRRSACLALGNLVIEEDAREDFLNIAMSVRALSEQLKSRDRFLVRYATGAMRNVAVDEKGRRAVLAQQDAVAALKGLLASPDQTTAKFAASALRNLSLTPFETNMGPSDPKGKPYQGSSRIQVPERTTASFMGFPVPFADSDGRDIPLTVSQAKAANGAIAL